MAPRSLRRRPGTSALFALAIAFLTAAAQAQTVTGTVRDALTSAPLRSMVVAAYTSSGTLQANVTTDANGQYGVSLPSGSYRVLAYDPTGGYATQFANDAPSFEESPATVVSAGQTATVNFALRRGGSVSGVVFTSAGPLPGMTVAAYNLSGTRRGFATTNSSGGYSMVLPPGDYKIVAYDDGGTFAPAFFRDDTTFEEADVVTVTAGRTETSLDLFLQTGAHVNGIVTDASGVPLSNVAVFAYTTAGKFAAVATTGADGRYALTLLPGMYRFVAIDYSFTYAAGFLNDAPAFETSPAIALVANQTRSDLSFRLERGGLVEGRVVDAATGEGIVGITVAAYNLDGTQRTLVTTDANGRFVLLLPPGHFRIGAFDPALVYATQFYAQEKTFARAQAVTASVGQTITLQPFTLARGGRIGGTLTDQVTGQRLAGAIVAAYGSDGEFIAAATTSAAGMYRLVLPEGTYRLVAFDPQLRYAPAFIAGATSYDTSSPVTIAPGSDLTADFSLRRGTLVNGMVVDPSSRPLAGIEVTALDLDQNRVASATTAADGSFQIALVPGTYKFMAIDPWHRFRPSYLGGSTFASATAVTIDATGAPHVTVVVQPLTRRRAVAR